GPARAPGAPQLPRVLGRHPQAVERRERARRGALAVHAEPGVEELEVPPRAARREPLRPRLHVFGRVRLRREPEVRAAREAARQAAQTLGLDADQARAYAAGALLADLDKAGRLSKAFHGNAALVRAFQGCSQDGPVLRAQTHDPEGALVKALLQSPDRLVRAF